MPQFIDDLLATYLKNQITGIDAGRVKLALQEVCRLYSQGYRFQPQVRPEIEIATVGQLEIKMSDNKVRRWCLNVLALIGSHELSKDIIERVIEKFQCDPDTISSALTAYFKVYSSAYSDLRKRSYVSPQQIILAGYIGGQRLKVRHDATTINIDSDEPEILRAALVAVGLRKAPENIFDPRYDNADLVRQLSNHDDLTVAQYAVWSINEHPELGIDHLGFHTADIEALPANMRSWTYRLYAEAGDFNPLRHDVIQMGTTDLDVEVRHNLARGLRDAWYDGLEEITSEWFHTEQNEAVREEITDHIIRQSDKCPVYSKIGFETYTRVQANSSQAQRMMAAAKGRELYREFRRHDYQAEADLFGPEANTFMGAPTVTNNNTYNIGNVQGAAVSLGGDSRQEGNNTLTFEQKQQLAKGLEDLARELHALNNPPREVIELRDLLEQASREQKPALLQQVSSGIKGLLSGVGKLTKIGADTAKIVGLAKLILPLL